MSETPALTLSAVVAWIRAHPDASDLKEIARAVEARREQNDCAVRTALLQTKFPEDPTICCTHFLYETADYMRAWSMTVVMSGWTIEMYTRGGFSDPTMDGDIVFRAHATDGSEHLLVADNGCDVEYCDDDVTRDDLCTLCERALSCTLCS